jgi:hypothetical protein
VTYQRIDGKVPDKDAVQLMNAIDDHSVIANVNATGKNSTPNGEIVVGGAFLDTDVITQDGITKAVSFQQVNPDQLESQSNYYGKPGKDMLHEITESYIAGRLSPTTSEASSQSGAALSVYEIAHATAVPQPGEQFEDDQDANGKHVSQPVSGGTIIYFNQMKGKKDNILYTYPVP